MIRTMDDARLARLIRVLRHQRGWRQADLAARAGVGSDAVVRFEAGRLGQMQMSTIRAIVAAVGLSYEGAVRGLRASEDRLLDERHATLSGGCATWLTSLDWLMRSEISYSEWGERGSVDLLAWHAATRSLIVIEIKTELASIEATLRKLDEKTRLASAIVRPFGWRPASVSRLLVLPEDRTQRRRVVAHASILEAAFPLRTRAVRTWCKAPAGLIAGLMFLASPPTARTVPGRAGRVRRRRVSPPRIPGPQGQPRPPHVRSTQLAPEPR